MYYNVLHSIIRLQIKINSTNNDLKFIDYLEPKSFNTLNTNYKKCLRTNSKNNINRYLLK